MVAPAVLVLLLAACDAAVVKHKVKVTPVEKVIELLEKLKEGTAAESQADAKTYDEFACFCKEQADNKLYAITNSKELIKQQTAKIKVLKSDITSLNGEISDLTEKIEKLSGEQKEADETRAKEFEAYSEEESKLSKAISAVDRAIKALEESKEGMVDAKLNLKQAKAILSKRQFSEVLALVELAEPGKPAAYEYRSNDIISTLKGLLKTFKQKKVEVDTEEANTRNDYEMAKQARENTIAFAEKDKAEKEALVASKEKELEETKQAKKEETDMMNADQAFMDELTTTCEQKAKDFDQRSETRVAEITAITKALEILRSGVQPNYSANKKLTGLLSTAVTADEPAGHLSQVKSHNAPELITADDMVLRDDDEEAGDVEFIQLRGAASKAGKFPKAMAFLANKAVQLKSPVLSTLMTKIKLGYGAKLGLSKDHFVKVRGIIKDLISKLEADAESEATQKTFCDEEMKKATTDRDEAIGEVEAQTANIDKAKAKIAELIEEIDTLATEIADLRKGLFEATELRAAEKADNEKTIGDSEAGLEAVKDAIAVLKDFYDNAFVQTGFVPAGADRDGNTVADLAPAGQEGEYHGNTDAAKGIFGLLEVIQADFERTIDKTTSEEEDAQKEFEKYEEETKKSIDEKGEEKKKKEEDKEQTEADLVEYQDKLKDAEEMLASAKEELEKLKPLCVDTGMDWKERRARQEQEIAALKEALAILSEI
jgi:predicted  nucleic acid-binding Zn-ribbon protein